MTIIEFVSSISHEDDSIELATKWRLFEETNDLNDLEGGWDE